MHTSSVTLATLFFSTLTFGLSGPQNKVMQPEKTEWDSLPDCANKCVGDLITKLDAECKQSTLECLCTKEKYTKEMGECWSQNCNQEALASAMAAARSICSKVRSEGAGPDHAHSKKSTEVENDDDENEDEDEDEDEGENKVEDEVEVEDEDEDEDEDDSTGVTDSGDTGLSGQERKGSNTSLPLDSNGAKGKGEYNLTRFSNSTQTNVPTSSSLPTGSGTNTTATGCTDESKCSGPTGTSSPGSSSSSATTAQADANAKTNEPQESKATKLSTAICLHSITIVLASLFFSYLI